MIELLADPHVHAAPSTKPRFGSDLDLIDSAEQRGIRAFVLKSHHEQTASRALIANEYARRIGASVRAGGSVVLNPWTHYSEVERAVTLGVQTIWWPTADSTGQVKNLDLPTVHRAVLDLIEGTDVRIATGHLKHDAAIELVKSAVDRGIAVAATHPLNPHVGNGLEAALELASMGAIVEIDALSIKLLIGADVDVNAVLGELLGGGTDAYLCSDGGQRENGDPFAFMRQTFAQLGESLLPRLQECAHASARWLNGGER